MAKVDYGMASERTLIVLTVQSVIGMMLFHLMGHLGDRFGYRRVMGLSTAITAALALPAFQLIHVAGSAEVIVAIQIVMMLILTGFVGPLCAYLSSLFPANVRFSGIALGWGVSLSIFGGATPFINSSLVYLTGDPRLPSLYLLTAALLGLMGVSGRVRMYDVPEGQRSQKRMKQIA